MKQQNISTIKKHVSKETHPTNSHPVSMSTAVIEFVCPTVRDHNHFHDRHNEIIKRHNDKQTEKQLIKRAITVTVADSQHQHQLQQNTTWTLENFIISQPA